VRVCSASLTLAIAYLRQPSAASPPLCDPLSKVSRHRALIVISHLSLPAMHTYGCHLPVQARLTKYVTSETETHRQILTVVKSHQSRSRLGGWRASRRHAPRHATAHHSTRGADRLGSRRRRARATPTPGAMAGGRAAPQQEFCSALTITVPRTHTTTLNAHSERNDSSRSRFKLEVRRVRPTRTAPTPQGDRG
jgi:hypothetical protein